MHQLSAASRKKVSGMSLIESLIALLVLALGLLGLAGMQARLLAENRISNQRAVAIGLIDDMVNRMQFNRLAAMSGVNATPPTAGSYELAWSAAATAAQDCVGQQCTGAEMAQSDLNQWRANLAAALPSANARIFVSGTDARQIGVAIGWSSNEGAAASDAAYTTPFSVTAANAGVACPSGLICHVVYFQP